MLLLGIPYTHPDLMTTQTGGSPYGATHWSGIKGDKLISEEEKKLTIGLGRRLAETARQLHPPRP